MKRPNSIKDLWGWHYIYEKDISDIYMARYWFWRLRLHIFYRGDNDPDPHDHAWGFYTFPLVSYVEEVTVLEPKWVKVQGRPIWVHDPIAGPRMIETDSRELQNLPRVYYQIVRAFRWHWRPATHTHRVLGKWNGEFLNLKTKYYYRKGELDFDLANEHTDLFQPQLAEGKVVTLVWRTEKQRDWGFLKTRDGRSCWIKAVDYFSGREKNTPC